MYERKVTLTFDDGPSPYTEPILDLLKRYPIKAVFFDIGVNIRRYPEVVIRTAEEDHLVGNHTFDHRVDPSLKGILFSQGLIEGYTGQRLRLFRMPFTPAPPWIERKLKRHNIAVPPIGIMGFDWDQGLTAEQIALNVIRGVQGDDRIYSSLPWEQGLHRWLRSRYSKVFSRSVILLHDGGGVDPDVDRSRTVAALPIIIETLRDAGYQFVSLEEIMR